MRRCLTLITHVALLGGVVATGAPQSPAPGAPPVRFELPNGLRVWVQEDHVRPVVLVQTTYKVGSINDGPGTTGMAHYVEHMAYRATQNIRNEDIYGFVDRVGGRYTGGTAQMATTYTETVPSWALEEALRTNAERMGRALFDVTEFERERTNVITEANGYVLTGAAQILRAEVMSASFELHPYRYSSATWAQDNLVLTRDQAYDFYKSYYGPNNVVLAVIGDVKPEEVRRLVEKHFASLERAPLSGAVTVVEPPQRVEKRITLVYPDSEKHLDIVYRAPQADHEDYPALAVLDRVLGVRLNRVMTANGGNGNALTTSHSMTPYPYVYRIAATASESADLERLVTAIQREIDRVEAEGVTTQELEAARADAQRGPGGRGGRGGAQQSQSTGAPPRQSSLTQIATQLTNSEVFTWDVGPETRDRVRAQTAKVTSADLQAYVRQWLRPWMRTVGFHSPGTSNYTPVWSNGREIAGDRLAIPPLSVRPAKRQRPDALPARALEPLTSLAIQTGRRELANGVVVRAARSEGTTAALQIRIQVGAATDPSGKDGLPWLAARLISGDPGLSSFAPRASTASIANDGYFDILLNFPASSTTAAVAAAVAALRNTSPTPARIEQASRPPDGAGGRGGGRGSAVNMDARNRVLGTVAPLWNAVDLGSASLAGLRPTDVSNFLSQRLTGGAVTVGLVGPSDATQLLDVVSGAFLTLERGRRTADDRPPQGGAARPGVTPVEERIPLASEPQVTVLAGLPGVPRNHPDRRVLDLLNYIVGVPSYGGRLGWALTKTGLTYSSAATTTFGTITGHILFNTKCDTKNLESTIQAIREVIAGVGEKGVDDWELREAQSFALGRTLLYGPREDSGEDAIASALLDSEYSGNELLDLPAFSRATLGVTLQQLNAVARRYYRPELLKVVAIGAVPNGPQKTIFPAGTFRALFEP